MPTAAEFCGTGYSAGVCFDREGLEEGVQIEMMIEKGVASGMGWAALKRKERDEDKEGEKRLDFAARYP